MTGMFKKIKEWGNKDGDPNGVNSKRIMDELESRMFFNELNIKQLEDEAKDYRYNEPKGKHKAPEYVISETIESTEIYSRAKELILNAQRKQVGYGLDKYPKPLNADTWTTVETIDHIIDESIDKLHYLVMLRVKLEKELNQESQPVEDLPDTQIKMKTTVGKEFPFAKVDFDEQLYIDNWVVTPSPISHDLEIEYTLRGESPKKLTIEGYMLRDNDICDMDSLRYAVLEAIRNDRF